MSEATQKVRDFLTKSPSVVYPDDVLELFEQVEYENIKLRELVIALQHCRDGRCNSECPMFTPADNNRGVPPVCEAYGIMRKLGVEMQHV